MFSSPPSESWSESADDGIASPAPCPAIGFVACQYGSSLQWAERGRPPRPPRTRRVGACMSC